MVTTLNALANRLDLFLAPKKHLVGNRAFDNIRRQTRQLYALLENDLDQMAGRTACDNAGKRLAVQNNKVCTVDGVSDKTPHVVCLATGSIDWRKHTQQSEELGSLRHLQLSQHRFKKLRWMAVVGYEKYREARVANP